MVAQTKQFGDLGEVVVHGNLFLKKKKKKKLGEGPTKAWKNKGGKTQ